MARAKGVPDTRQTNGSLLGTNELSRTTRERSLLHTPLRHVSHLHLNSVETANSSIDVDGGTGRNAMYKRWLRIVDRQLLHRCCRDSSGQSTIGVVMDKRRPIRQQGAKVMTHKAQRHFQCIAVRNGLDRTERHATAEQFATAARMAAVAVSKCSK